MSRRSRLFVSTQVKDWGQSPLTRVPYVFSPAEVSPDLWLDASDAGTITASSGDVSQWNNKGSLGNFTQPTGAVQPKTGVTTLNGLNVLDFAGDYLVAANQNEWKFLHDGTKYVVAAVVKFGTGSNPATELVLFGSSGGATANVGVSYFYDDGGANNNNFAYVVFRGVGGTTAVVHSVPNYISPNAFCVLSSIADPGNATANDRSEVFLNASSGTKGQTQTNAQSTANPTRALEIGRDNFGVLTGSIAELIIVSGANATETNRAKLRDYLDEKWAVY